MKRGNQPKQANESGGPAAKRKVSCFCLRKICTQSLAFLLILSDC